MKKAFIIIILCMILQIFTVTVYANDSNVNIVSADNYESREFNQWKRAKYDFSFNVSTEKKTIKALSQPCEGTGIKRPDLGTPCP